jgi:hypothetical protein
MLLEVQWLDMSRPNRLSASQQPILLLQPTQALILLIQIESSKPKKRDGRRNQRIGIGKAKGSRKIYRRPKS